MANNKLMGIQEDGSGVLVHNWPIVGMIVAYCGDAKSLPAGWYICDGKNGTPDLIERFILGGKRDIGIGKVNSKELRLDSENLHGTTDVKTVSGNITDFTINGTSLSTAQMPKHAHLTGPGLATDFQAMDSNNYNVTEDYKAALSPRGDNSWEEHGDKGWRHFTRIVQGISNVGGYHYNPTWKVERSGKGTVYPLTEDKGSGEEHSHTGSAKFSGDSHHHSFAVAVPYYELAYIMYTGKQAED